MSIILFNSSLEIGGWLNTATQNITGSMFITVVFVLLLFLTIAALFRIPLSFFLILLLPLVIIFSMWDITGASTVILGMVIFIVGWQLAKMIFAYR